MKLNQISEEEICWWNKSKNLYFLKNNLDSNEDFLIPKFLVFSSLDNLEQLFNEKIKNFSWKLAIRSDSEFEDSEDDSWAWVFETILNVWNSLEEIKSAIEKIQKDAKEKVWKEISLVIQEMVVPEKAWTVFWVDSRNENKNSYTINYINWLWTWVVDWNSETQTRIVNKNFSFKNKDDFISNLLESVKKVEKIFDNNLLDIEFAYANWKIYILQVRPLTALEDWNCFKQDYFIKKVLSIISKEVTKERIILWDMIDINPAELLNNTKKNFINTLFAEIFPAWPLKNARKDLWYQISENEMYSIVLNKFYINLEENLISFLPKDLDEEETQIFVNYYKDLLTKNPNLQDKLDTVEYPNNINIVKKILEKSEISKEKKEKIIKKFKIFFKKLEEKFDKLEENYFNIQENILKKFFLIDSWKIEDIDLEKLKDCSFEKLLETIKKITYSFTQYARGAFYYRNHNQEENLEIYNYYKYNNLLAWVEKKFYIPNGFDILDNIEISFENEEKKLLNKNYKPIKKEIFELARENLKFLFMLLLTKFWEILKKETEKIGLNNQEIYNLSFKELLANINNINKLKSLINKRTERKEKLDKLNLPSIISENSLVWNYELLSSWTYIWEEETNWTVIYIENIKELYDMNFEKLNWKILFLDTATPEIDWVLWELLAKVKAIVTKYWWPWAHITLRIREENKRRKAEGLKEIWLVVWLWDNFDTLKTETEKIFINFKKEKIW